MVQKIYRCCESVKRFRMNKMTAYQKAKFLENIDSIFNISKCQHKFRSCLESDCPTVSCKIKDLHLDCTYLPVERAFMQDQKLRRKQGDRARYQMSIVNRRQAKRDERTLEKRADVDGLEPQVEEVIEDVGEEISTRMKVRVMKVKVTQVLNIKMML